MENDVKIKAEKLFAFLWFFSFIWFFAAQALVGSAWHDPAYNWREQNVSDLGQIGYPFSFLMNIAFILQGAVMAAGVWLIKVIWHRTLLPAIARTMLVLTGAGFIIVGLTPYNVIPFVHSFFGAFPVMLFSSAGLILAGLANCRKSCGSFWIVTIALGLASLASGILYFTGHYLFLGKGAMERIWIYAPLVWTLVISCRVIFLFRRPALQDANDCADNNRNQYLRN